MSDTLEAVIQEKTVLILLGAGGVGKTTTSVALAVKAALAGQRVGLLSIDPAKRLAAAMGIKLGADPSPIELGPGCKGYLEAAMLDQTAVFDDMVERFSPSAGVASKIREHSFYKAASTNLAGAVEYMALAKLQQMKESEKYDLIVVDTPPDAHALDFLARPNQLSSFIESKVTTWMLKPFALAKKFGLGKALSKGEKLMGGLASVTGIGALQMMAEFLVLLQEVMEGFHQAGSSVKETMSSPETGFVLVSTSRRAPVRTSLHIVNQLHEIGYTLDAIVVNRCLPNGVARESESVSLESLNLDLSDPCAAIFADQRFEAACVSTLRTAVEAKQTRQPIVVQVPEQEELLENTATMTQLAHQL